MVLLMQEHTESETGNTKTLVVKLSAIDRTGINIKLIRTLTNERQAVKALMKLLKISSAYARVIYKAADNKLKWVGMKLYIDLTN